MSRSNGSPQKSTLGTDEPTTAQLAAIAVMAAGGTVVAAARAAGVERSVIYKRWFKDPVFVAALNAAKRDQAEEFAAQRREIAREAVQALRDMLEPRAPLKYRLASAKAVLEVCGHPEPQSYGPTTPEDVRREWERHERDRAAAMRRRAESIVDERHRPPMVRFDDLSDAQRDAEIAQVLDELRAEGDQGDP